MYYPVHHRELPTELAKVRDTDSALVFYSKWGRLDRAVIYRGDLVEAETLDWLYAHAGGVRIVIKLITLRQNGSPAQVRDELLDLASRSDTIKLAYGSFDRIGQLTVERDRAGRNPMETSAEIVSFIINVNMSGLELTVAPDEQEKGVLVRSYAFPALLTVVYAHLADAAVERTSIYQCAYRNCENWHTVAVARGPKPRYCPPPP